MAKFVAASTSWEQELDMRIDAKVVRPVAEDILREMKDGVPEDSGDLHDSLEIDYTHNGAKIGSKLGYAATVELGSGPHIIRVKSKKVLRNPETGQVFGKQVLHPGTPAQPYMVPALERVRASNGPQS